MILLYLLIGIGWTVAQTVKVSGTVISDEDGQPIIGAAVTVRGAAHAGTVTDMDGHYALNVPASAKTLIISYVGMRSEEIPISDKHVTTVLRANLALDEVVVTALGISREKKALGYIIRQSKSTMAPIKKYKNGTCFSRPVFCIPFTPRKGAFSPLLIVYFTSWKVVE